MAENPEIEIRPFEDTTLDRAGLVEVVAAAFVHDRWVNDPVIDPDRLPPMFADGALQAAERAIDQPARHFAFLAVAGDSVVGVALGGIEARILEFTEVRVGSLWSLAVREDHRRRGIGTRLFGAVREWMEARDCAELSVSTDAPNEANRLYEKLGLSRVHELVTWKLDLE